GLEPLYFGNFLLIPASLLFYGFIVRKWLLWVALPILLLVTEVWLTLSRGAILALCLEAVLFLVISIFTRSIRRGICIVVLTGFGSLCATGLISFGTHHAVKKNFQSSHAVSNFSKQATNFSTGESAIGRRETRDLAIQAWHEHPLLGIGPGEFGYYAHLHNPDRYGENHTIVNNEPLELLAETGALGLLALGTFVALLLYAVMKTALSRPDWYRSLVLPLVIALIGISFQYLSFSTLYITHLWIIFGLLAASTYKKSTVV
ncbi:MAG: O-antigen ligase family protein, partial [Candidatus Saccharibacteria bacterium]